MIEGFRRIDDRTMSLVRDFAHQYGCSDEVALKYLLKVGKYPQGAGEDDEAYAARLDRLPDPDVVAHGAFRPRMTREVLVVPTATATLAILLGHAAFVLGMALLPHLIDPVFIVLSMQRSGRACG